MGKGNIIGKLNEPTINVGTGVWDLPEQYLARRSNIWVPSSYGKTASNPASSAQDIIDVAGTRIDGLYYINLPTVGVTPVYCLLDSKWNGGGWMMAMKATTGTTFSYSSTYWTTSNTLNTTSNNRSNEDAKFETMNRFQAKDILAVWPDITTNGVNSGSISNLPEWTWLENNFNGGTRQTLISFFSSPSNLTYTSPSTGGSGYFLRDAKTFSGWSSGVFSSQVDIRFYGFNYVNNPTYGLSAKVRWGFGWNENSEGLFPSSGGGAPGSNDVSGGIGMDSSFGSYSAGDRISCCQDTAGINRSARVEIYIR